MSFPTFSGSSRRPRNVNMSGQKNLNPFAAASWSPSASSGASKTVADAQAERRQRQQERDKLKAAESIQRTWRGHRVRRTLRDERRTAFDKLYRNPEYTNQELRSSEALYLTVSALDPNRPDDRQRLQIFAQDLEASDCAALTSASTAQIRKLVKQLLVVLKRYEVPLPMGQAGSAGCFTDSSHSSLNNDEVPRSILLPLVTICQKRLEAVEDSLDTLYGVVGRFCQNEDIKDPRSLELLEQAILIPILGSSGQRASRAFAMCFLTQPNLKLFEANVTAFAERVDVEKISAAIVEAYSAGWATPQPPDVRLWLLAHFIALGNSKKDVSLGSSYLNAMYIQLSSLHVELKKYHIGQGPTSGTDSSSKPQKQLPPFIEKAIESLVARDEISHILEKFTT